MPTAVLEARPEPPSYFQTLIGLIRHPNLFFSEIKVSGLRIPFRMLFISALFHAAVCFTYVYARSVSLTLVLMANSLAMPFIMAGLAWMLKTTMFGREQDFDKFFAAFAYASSVTLLFSWIPALGLFIEPWRLFIASVGLAKCCNLGWKKGLIILAMSVFLLLLLLWSALPVIMQIKAMVA